MEDGDVTPDDSGHLKVQYLGWSHIHPDVWGFSEKLVALDVSFNNLTSLPEELGILRLLTNLNCSCNQINSLPSSIGRLQTLKIFKANGNKIAPSLPDEIGQCINLTILNLNENQLEYLPDTIVNCFNLTSLSLQNNNMKKLPSKLSLLHSTINLIDVRNNPNLHSIPEKMHDNTAAILWILSIHYKNVMELIDLQGEIKKKGAIIRLNRDKIVKAQEQLDKLRETQAILIDERNSINWFLNIRNALTGFNRRREIFATKCKELLTKEKLTTPFSTYL